MAPDAEAQSDWAGGRVHHCSSVGVELVGSWVAGLPSNIRKMLKGKVLPDFTYKASMELAQKKGSCPGLLVGQPEAQRLVFIFALQGSGAF